MRRASLGRIVGVNCLTGIARQLDDGLGVEHQRRLVAVGEGARLRS